MCTKKFLTLTFRSLRNQEKKRSIFSYLKQQKQIITSFKKLSLTLKYKITQVKSRLNFFLISDKFQHDVTKVETRESIAPEHKQSFWALIWMGNLSAALAYGNLITLFSRTNAIWRLMKHYYPCILQKHTAVYNKQFLWKWIKVEIRSETIPYI